MTTVWSCGGGTQSAAIAGLIVQGRLPKPDLAVIIDTGREKSSTWDYLDRVLRPECAKVGLEINRVESEKFTDIEPFNDEGTLLIPNFTTLSGDTGKTPVFCSGKWKRDVIGSWLRSIGLSPSKGDKVCSWVGISRDEMRRIRVPRQLWRTEHYPLIFDVPMTRGECLQYVCDEMGWPEPPRSSCWMCPNMRNTEWRILKDEHPKDFAKAVEFEREIHRRDPHAWLHEDCKPLDKIDFSQPQQALPLGNGCASGMCWA